MYVIEALSDMVITIKSHKLINPLYRHLGQERITGRNTKRLASHW